MWRDLDNFRYISYSYNPTSYNYAKHTIEKLNDRLEELREKKPTITEIHYVTKKENL